ncbi:MAG TPA: presenilin family intramembrane aspartyl protease PSH [Candidatus Thermoplasmatota archaeon]|nr:presenilin family intramembrane aspartyl protease PSH [Candidatus Thermoplasmatota archaeon]
MEPAAEGTKPTPAPTAAGGTASAPVTASELWATAALLGFFVVTMVLAVLVAQPSQDSGLQQFEDPEDPVNVLVYLALILGFTFFILWVAKRGWKWIIRWLILLAVGSSIIFVTYPILTQASGLGMTTSLVVSLVAAAAITVALWKHPEWYVIDTAGVLVAAGAASVFGISFVPWLVVLLLVLLAVYDAIAVYRTKHMLSLADTVIELRLPVLLVIPKHTGYRFREDAARMKKATKATKQEREAMFMGLGDLVMPTILVVSALVFLPAGARPLEADALPAGVEGQPQDLPLLLEASAERTEEGLRVRYTISSPDAAAQGSAWSLDWDADEDVDEDGVGLPATVLADYTTPGLYLVQAKASDGGREGAAALEVRVHDPSPWHRALRDFVEHPPALGAALGTVAGYLVLMAFVLKGNPQAGLPLLNGGAITGFLLGVWRMTGSFVFW